MTSDTRGARDLLRGDTLKTAVSALLAYKVRALLSMIGVVIGSASIVLVVTAGLTGGRYVTAQIEGVGSNIAYAQHVRGRQSTSALSDELTLADLQAVKTGVPEVVDVAGSRDVSVTVVAAGRERAVALIGVTDGFQRIRHLVVVRGRYFDGDEAASSDKVCLLTDELAAAMFPDSDPIGSIARIGEFRLTVIGVIRERVSTFGTSELQRESVLVPFPLMRYITGTEYLKVLYVQASSPEHGLRRYTRAWRRAQSAASQRCKISGGKSDRAACCGRQNLHRSRRHTAGRRVHRLARQRHWYHECHARKRDREDPRDRGPKDRRCTATEHHESVPDRGCDRQRSRRRWRRRARDRHRRLDTVVPAGRRELADIDRVRSPRARRFGWSRVDVRIPARQTSSKPAYRGCAAP